MLVLVLAHSHCEGAPPFFFLFILIFFFVLVFLPFGVVVVENKEKLTFKDAATPDKRPVLTLYLFLFVKEC